jgi:acetyl esterase/lipase
MNRQQWVMAYVIAAVSLWMIVSALTALRPGRRGLFAAFAYPVGWAAGELPVQAIIVQLALLALLRWWGWPRTSWLGPLVLILALVVTLENLVLIVVQLLSRTVVRRALAASPRRPLSVGRPREDVAGSWWRTMLQVPFHPSNVQVIANVAYGAHPRQVLDIWRTSRTPQNAPVIIYFHGGAWTFGDKREQGRPMLHEFVERGWIVVTSNYRLAPSNRWPAHIVDAKRVLGFTKKNIANYGGDPQRVVVAGGSAGGHLASLLALSEREEWLSPDQADVADWSVRGCVALYSVLEMTGDETHWHGLGHGLRILLERRVVQVPFHDNVALYEQMSPLHRIDADSPPFLVVQGGNDTLVDVNVARGFVEKFRRVALAPIYYVELPLTQHAFDHTASPRTSATLRAAVAFAESVTAHRRPLNEELLASYQSPPVEVLVAVGESQWEPATDVASRRGSFYVVSADNAFSNPLDSGNELRRRELDDLARSRGLSALPALGRDPSGGWPEEKGLAIFEQSEEFCRALGRAFEQHAIYEVTPDDCRVVVVS